MREGFFVGYQLTHKASFTRSEIFYCLNNFERIRRSLIVFLPIETPAPDL